MIQPSLHLIKLFVGLAHFAELESFQRERVGTTNPRTGRIELAHVTRQTPKRAAELLAGGSIYWVMSGFIVGRQALRAFRPIDLNGKLHCAIVYDWPLIAVTPRPRRPFQGWRYLKPEEAPPDLTSGQASGGLPDGLHQELEKLGLV